MSGTYDNDTYFTDSELPQLDGDVIVLESPVQDHDEENDTAAVTTITETQDPQYLQVPKNQKLPMNRNEDCENTETNNKAIRFSITSTPRPVKLFTTERITIALKCQLVATLIFTIFIITLLSAVPVVLYTINPPRSGLQSIEVDVFQHLDFTTCSVDENKSQIDISDDLMELCNISNAGCELDTTAITGLYSVYTLGLTTNSQCARLSFFCNATLQLCNSDSPSVDLTEECEEVRDVKCISEWRIVENFYNKSIPDCISYGEDKNLTFNKAPAQPCPTYFEYFCNSTCLPICGEYSLLTQDTSSNLSLYLIVTTGVVGLIGGIITLIICYYKRCQLLKFPQIYIVYNTVIWEVFLSIQIFPLVAEKHLMCSVNNFLSSIKEPTAFCQLQGFIVQLLYLCFIGFWCFHLLHLFLSLAYPFKAKLWLDSPSCRNKIHLIEVIIVILFGLLYPVVTISATQYYYNGWYCAAVSASVAFYGGVVPRLVVFCIGLIFLFTSLWILRKQYRLKSSNITVSAVFCFKCSYSVGEVKLGLLFGYYVVTLLFYFAGAIIHLMTRDESFAKMAEYIHCSVGGYREKCDEHKASFAVSSVVTAVAVMLVLLINLCHLMYVIHFQTVKQAIKRLFVC